MIDENLRQKIQKLFIMARRGEGNEAEIALEKARSLMRNYGVTESDVELFIVETPDSRKKKPRWVMRLHEICATFCGCVSLYSIKSFTFAGDEIGVNVARELFVYLEKEIVRKTSEQLLFGRKLKNDFRLGVVYGLKEKMEECGGWRDMKEKQRGLEEKHFSENPRPRIGERYVSSFYKAGKEKAKDINLSRQAGHVARGLLQEDEANGPLQ